jgi:hypothetical protein
MLMLDDAFHHVDCYIVCFYYYYVVAFHCLFCYSANTRLRNASSVSLFEYCSQVTIVVLMFYSMFYVCCHSFIWLVD